MLRFRRTGNPPRAWSPLDAFICNALAMGVPVLLIATLAPALDPRLSLDSMLVAFALVGAIGTAEAVVYAFVASTLPRDGGDYYYQRRLVGEGVAAVFGLVGIVSSALWMLVAAWVATRVAMGPLLVLLGSALRSPLVAHVGSWAMSTAGLVAAGLVGVGWAAVVNALGMKRFARVERGISVLVVVALAALALSIVLWGAVPSDALLAALSSQAQANGWFGEGGVIGLKAGPLLPLALLVALLNPGWGSFLSGEIQRGSELQMNLLIGVGPKLLGAIVGVATLALSAGFGSGMPWAAAVYLALRNPESLLAVGSETTLASSSASIVWLPPTALATAVLVLLWAWVPGLTLTASRVMLAMSWDGLLPRWTSDLRDRSGAPIRAIILFSGTCALFIAAYAAIGVTTAVVHATAISVATVAVTCAAAAVFPVTRPELYRASTASPFEVAVVPVISLVGAAVTALVACLAWNGLGVGSSLGGGGSAASVVLLSCMFLAAAAVYALFRRYRRHHEGADVSLFFHEPASHDREAPSRF